MIHLQKVKLFLINLAHFCQIYHPLSGSIHFGYFQIFFIFYYLSRTFSRLSSVWKKWGLESLKCTVTYQGIKLPSIALVPTCIFPQLQVANLCSPMLGTKSCLYNISLHSLHWIAVNLPKHLSYRLLAARVGLEPTTSRLTAERTAIVLPCIKIISTDDRTWTGTS